MIQYRIRDEAPSVVVELTEAGGHEKELLQAFGECRSGHCTCPTDEYQKVASMDVRHGQQLITLRLQAKPGTRFNPAEIAACLDHTVGKLGRR